MIDYRSDRQLSLAQCKRRRHGFTLVELIVVVLIITVLSVAVFSGGSAALARAKKARVVNDFKSFQVAFESVLIDHPEVADIAATTNKEKLEGVMEALNKELDSDYQLRAITEAMPTGSVQKIAVTPSNTNYVICESQYKDPWKNPYYVIIDRQNRVQDSRYAEFFITAVTAGPNAVLNLDGFIDKDDIFMLTSYVNGEVKSVIYDASESAPTIANGSAAAMSFVIASAAPVNNGITTNAISAGSGGSTPVLDPNAPSNYSISVDVTNGDYIGDTAIDNGGNATVRISADPGYNLPDYVSISGAVGFYNSSTGVIFLSNPTADVTIVANCSDAVSIYEISTVVNNGFYSGSSEIVKNGYASVKVTPNAGYLLPNEISVSGAVASYNASTGTISLSKPSASVSIVVNCSPADYTISTTVTHGTFTGATGINQNGSASVKITANSGYQRPSSVTVTGATSDYNRSTGIISLSNPTGNVTIIANCPARGSSYKISTTVTHGTYTGSTTIDKDGNASVRISASDGYSLPISVTVTGATHTYESSTGVISLSNPTGNVTINANCPVITYPISTTVMYGTYTGDTTIPKNGSASVTISANSGYELPDSVTVTGVLAFSYNSSTGVVTLNNPTGNVTISAICQRLGYISFTNSGYISISTALNTKNWDGTLEWCDAGHPWTTWNGEQAITTTTGTINIRGTGNTTITGNSIAGEKNWVVQGDSVSCSGNIETLLDYTKATNGQHPSMASYCFSYLFYNCTSLVSAPALPATTLTTYCYSNMFQGCTNLIAAPALPATTLATYCYSYMFQGCTSLTSVLVLPSTTLATHCYEYMFKGCTNLTTAPALPATTMKDGCYYHMFEGCSNLTSAPVLPATTLASSCYSHMFKDCTTLASPPPLPATTLKGYCYQRMFRGCANLKISSTKTGEYQYEYRIPTTGSASTADYWNDGMFSSTGGTFTDDPSTGVTYYITNSPVTATQSYISFTSPDNFSIATANNKKNWNGALEWSNGLSEWTVWDGTSAIETDTGLILLRGIGNRYITTNTSNENAKWVLSGTQIVCYGNIESLLNHATVAANGHPVMDPYCYSYLFSDCSALTVAPELSAITLSQSCYQNLFQGCTNLTSVPTLPATTLARYCYSAMFQGCTSLTSAPAMSATTLADYCCQYMFQGCTSLTSAPVLSATTMSDYCYQYMFQGCIDLTTAPALPATTLASSCYNSMFSGCTSLVSAPKLSAATMVENCYRSMFCDCTSLTSPPGLFATTLAESCYREMFMNCTSLNTLPVLHSMMQADNCYNKMFYGCSSLRFSTTPSAEYRYSYIIPNVNDSVDSTGWNTDMFTNTGGTYTDDPSIKTLYYTVNPIVATPYLSFISSDSFSIATANGAKNWNATIEWSDGATEWATWTGTTIPTNTGIIKLRGTNNSYLAGTVTTNNTTRRWVLTGSNIGCSGNIENLLSYTEVSSGMHPTMSSSYYCFCGLFADCTALITAPELLARTLKDGCYLNMFSGCTSLVSAPELPATTLANNCYQYMFSGCTNLTSAPALPATSLAEYCYNYMFSGCTSLTSPPALPATAVSTYCYSYMFQGCTNLTSAPVLSAMTMQTHCYDSMFDGCTALTTPPALPATTVSTYCYQYMFNGCTNLESAPALPAKTMKTCCYRGMFGGCTKLKISSAQTGDYQYAYRIPKTVTGDTGGTTNWNSGMFSGTGGTFTGAPNINTTYYTTNPPVS